LFGLFDVLKVAGFLLLHVRDVCLFACMCVLWFVVCQEVGQLDCLVWARHIPVARVEGAGTCSHVVCLTSAASTP
jgi:hypothetical protein